MNTQLHAAVMPAVEPDSTDRVWPTYDHDIGLTEAREMITRFRRANPGAKSGAAMTRVALDRLLAQPGCAGLRCYYGMNPDMTMSLIVVGVDENMNDMDEGELAERAFPCPPFCSIDSALDS